ncbi:MAG: pilus assembly protein [Alphaproteobacteria bacterium]|nr:pilus assembly protein [Alphaproteobacteria bacterium]
MKLRRLDNAGATIVEFALVAPVFFLLLMAIIEFGLIGFHQVAIESAVAATAREASLGKAAPGGDRVEYVRTHLRQKLRGLINSSQLQISASTVVSGGTTASPDICMDDPPRLGGPCEPPLIYEETNDIPGYQGADASVSLGNAGDVVEVRVLYPWRVQLPLMSRFFGNNGVFLITANTIVKNEPF